MLEKFTHHQHVLSQEMNKQLNTMMKAHVVQDFNIIQQENGNKDPTPIPLRAKTMHQTPP